MEVSLKFSCLPYAVRIPLSNLGKKMDVKMTMHYAEAVNAKRALSIPRIGYNE